MPRYDYATRIASSKENLGQFERHVINPLVVDGPLPQLIVKWVTTLFTIVLNYFQDIMGILSNLVNDLEELERIPRVPPTSTIPNPVPTTRDTTSATRTRTSRRCAECHARGHIDTECRTKDPRLMRRRVATNIKRMKVNQVPAFSSPPVPLPWASTTLPPMPSNHQAFTAVAADAAELRRRRQQSNRDKRRAQRSATVTT